MTNSDIVVIELLSSLFSLIKQGKEVNLSVKWTHGELGEIPWQEQNTIYHAQKDLLYKIYEQIKKQMEEEVHENDY